METKSKERLEAQVATKVTSLALLLAFATWYIVKHIVPSLSGKPFSIESFNAVLFFLPLLGMGYAVYRINTMAFWKNALLTIVATCLSVFIVGYSFQF